MSRLGPRILVKADVESSIGRGCELYGAHFRPEMAAIVHAMAAASHQIYPHQFAFLRLTEGKRPPRVPGKRDLHAELRALDITFETDNGMRASEQQLRNIAFEAKSKLGSDYDVEIHAVGSDAVHIHAELDPQ